ncbi:hypothetical protein [Caulobacter sp. 17J80-11]|uniref:hypothetical protein n=1 Tax=Caulobacter sp. 17J80-11 TaxID=2763502 RepID=UPI001653AA88|nr:hypothetical protein [Caulobacter sp. 17J80-11]MBC6983452.1 hypothetical protein [Caulobacter sp. 17J80-11]
MSRECEPSDVELLGASLLLLEELGEAALSRHSHTLDWALSGLGLDAANDRSPGEMLAAFVTLARTRVADRAFEAAMAAGAMA